MTQKNILFSLSIALLIASLVGYFLFSIPHPKPITVHVDPKQLMIALTFDDGPNADYTPQILEILYDQQVPATFFITGQNLITHPHLVKEMVDYGHELGNHTFSHQDLTTLTTKQIKQEINKTQRALHKILPNYDFKYVRPPYSRYTKKVEQTSPLPLILWNLDSGDWKKNSTNKIYTTVCSQIKNHDIVIFHDDNQNTVEALKMIIPELKKQGFQFVTLSTLLDSY